MAEILAKYNPPVVEFFDVRLDCEAMFLLIQTLRVAKAELEVDEKIVTLLDALEAAYDKSPDAAPAVDDEAAAA